MANPADFNQNESQTSFQVQIPAQIHSGKQQETTPEVGSTDQQQQL